MDQLKGSLRFIPLPAVAQFIAGLGSTGRLKLTQGAWSGEIALRDGQIVGAQLGSDRGRAALEGMVLALAEAEFAFVDGPVEASEDPLVARDELTAYLAGLVAERQRLQIGFGALASVPCLVDQGPHATESSQVTINTAALQLIPALVYGHTLEQIAQRRGLARTLREVAMLCAGGLVRLEAAAAVSLPASATASAPSSAPRPVPPTVRPLRPAGAPTQTPQPSRRATWWQTNSANATATAPIELRRPRLLLDEEARGSQREEVRAASAASAEPRTAPSEVREVVAAARTAVADKRTDTVEARPIEPEELAMPRRSWRRALVGLFVREPAPQA